MVVLVLSLMIVALAATSTYDMEWTPLAQHLARCNDGTEAGYYIREGTNAGPWIIYLEGGGWCWDKESCDDRPKYRTSSDDYSTRESFVKQAGFLWPLHEKGANIVQVKYCSSDAWTGNISRPDLGKEFRGHVVVKGVFAQLHANHNLSNRVVLFAGCSAGGRGVLFNYNAIARQLQDYKVQRLVAFSDASIWLDADSEKHFEDVIPRKQAQAAGNYMAPILRAACDRAFTSADAWMCFMPGYMGQRKVDLLENNRSTFLKPVGPIIIHMDQNDKRNIWKQYPDEYASRIRDVMTSLAAADSNISVISPKCGNHCVSKEISGAGFGDRVGFFVNKIFGNTPRRNAAVDGISVLDIVGESLCNENSQSRTLISTDSSSTCD